MYNDRHRGKSGLPAQKRQMVMAQRTHASEETPIVKTVFLSSLFGVLASVVSGGILLTILCFVALGSEDPLSMIAPLSLLALLPSNLPSIPHLPASRLRQDAQKLSPNSFPQSRSPRFSSLAPNSPCLADLLSSAKSPTRLLPRAGHKISLHPRFYTVCASQ